MTIGHDCAWTTVGASKPAPFIAPSTNLLKPVIPNARKGAGDKVLSEEKRLSEKINGYKRREAVIRGTKS